jgi:hypothetical protein
MINHSGSEVILHIGDFVRVKASIRSPHAGRVGVLVRIDSGDTYGTHLVRFDDGLRFRYANDELEANAEVKGSRVAS